MPSWPSAVASTLRSPSSRASTSDSSICSCAAVVVALELQRARPVDARRQRRGADACAFGPGDGARRRRRHAGIVADEERERGAHAGGAGAKGVVVELLGDLLERGDVLGLLAAPAGDPTEAALYVLAQKGGVDVREFRRNNPRVVGAVRFRLQVHGHVPPDAG